MKCNLSAERLRQLFSYDPETGVFIRVANSGARYRNRKIGQIAGWKDARGYVVFRVENSKYMAHRLAWLYMTGHWPKQFIDHINGMKSDNRFANLREADDFINAQNIRQANRASQSGLLGASFKPEMKKPWAAQIQVNGRMKRLGFYDTAEEAHAAYLKAKRQLHAGCTI